MAKKNKKKMIEEEDNDDEKLELYPDEEQGILPPETSEQKKFDMEKNELDEDIDTSEGREKLVEEDEIDSWEEAFAEGASDGGKLSKDALTGEPLMDAEHVVEAEINGKMYRFVNEANARKFRKKKEQEEL